MADNNDKTFAGEERYMSKRISNSRAQRSLFYNLSKEKQRLESQGLNPDSKTIFKNLNVSESEVVEMRQILGHHDLSRVGGKNASLSGEMIKTGTG